KADSDVVPYFDYMSRDLQLGWAPTRSCRLWVRLISVTVLDIVGGLGTIPIEAATNFTNARVLSGHRELPARPTAPGQGKQYPCSIDHARDWDAADEDSIDWIVTDMPFGNCRGPKKTDMARVLHA
ncbi:hypothetical protein FOZ62_020015, partial [Perkinsus olseni]